MSAYSMADALPIAVAVLDTELRYRYANSEYGRYPGVDPQDLIGRDWRSAISERVYAIAEPHARRALGGEPTKFSLEADHPRFGHRHLLVCMAPEPDEAGRTIGIYLVLIDATAAKQAEDARRSSELLTQAVLDSIPFAMSVKDTAGRYLDFNRVAQDRRRVDLHQARGKDLAQLGIRSPEETLRNMAADREVLSTGARVELADLPFTAPDGTERWERLTKVPYRDESGEIVGVVTIGEDVTERRQAEQELGRSEARQRAILEAVPDLMFELDAAGTVLNFHASQPTDLTDPSGSFVGKKLRQVLPAPVAQAAEAAIAATLATGETRQLEYSLDTVEGEKQFEARIVPMGEQRVLAVVRNVTHAAAYRAALMSNERLLRQIIDTLPHWISVKGPDGHYLHVNRALAEDLGVDLELLRRQPNEAVAGLLPPQPEVMRELDAAVLHTKRQVVDAAARLTLPDGRVQVRSITKLPLHDEAGQLRGVLTWAADVTERLVAEAQVERSRRVMAQAETLAQMGALEWDLSTGEQYWSDGVYRILGRTPQERRPDAAFFSSVLHPEDRKRVLSKMSEATDGQRVVDLECRVVRPDGTVRQVHARGEIQRNDGGQKVRMVGTVQDVTEQRRAEMERRNAQKMEMLGELTGSVAHDFNNILQIVNGYAHIARKRAEGLPELAEDLQEVLSACDRGSNLARQLLSFSRRGHFRPEVMNLNERLQSLTKMIDLAIGEAARLELELDPTLPLIEADPAMLEQVVINLAVNARHAMPAGGRLTIRTAPVEQVGAPGEARDAERPGVLLQVSDTGTGIPAGIRDVIFEPYFTTREPGQGTGLGLATVYGIVQQHGGRIAVASEDGRGTTFSIWLPATEMALVLNAPQRQPRVRRGDETVLVAENEPQVLRMIEAMLTEQGYRVVSAPDGYQALARFRELEGRVDLALLDLVMPGLDGMATYRRLAEQAPDLPVVFITGDGNQAGPNLLHKPFTVEALSSAIRTALRGPHAR